MSTSASTFSIYLNYLQRRNESASGIILDFRTEYLRKTFATLNKAIQFIRAQRLKDDDALYIVERTQDTEKSVYYRTLRKEGYVS